MSDKKDAERDAAVNKAARPAMYAFGAAAVICVLGVFLNVAVPDLFVAFGGWLTVIGLLFVISVWAGLSMVRRTNKNAARADDQSGPTA
jgi:protein-S-isoprenylcysteine O-methyltransferase Ste14